MYLMIFFWSAALKSARAGSAAGGGGAELPFGLIFSSFMCAMMGGSLFFSLFAGKHNRESAAFVLLSDLLLASACLSAATLFADERLLFWALCVFEACVGAYFPSMSYLKSEMVDDGVRGRVYSILRFPLNVFVVVAHSLDEEGELPRSASLGWMGVDGDRRSTPELRLLDLRGASHGLVLCCQEELPGIRSTCRVLDTRRTLRFGTIPAPSLWGYGGETSSS